MADFERRQFEIGLESVHRSFAERNNFSEGSYEPKKDAQVIRVRGAAAPRVFFNSSYLFISNSMQDVCNSYCTSKCAWVYSLLESQGHTVIGMLYVPTCAKFKIHICAQRQT